MNEDDLRERFRVILAEEVDVFPATRDRIAARLAKAAKVGEIVEIARQEGTCTRCGKEVTRCGPDDRWRDFYGRDRCRASEDDDQCDVARVRDGVRYAQLVEAGHTTIILEGPGGEVALKQTIPAATGTAWVEDFREPILTRRISVRHETVRYRTVVTPEELAALNIPQSL